MTHVHASMCRKVQAEMEKCKSCNSDVQPTSRYCPRCGSELHATPRQVQSREPLQFWKKLDRKTQWSIAVVAGLAFILSFANAFSGGTNGQDNSPSSGLTVDFFGCSFGTMAASTIIKSSLEENVNAFVTVGLYAENGTLVHSATGYGLVEAGGSSLINISLRPYQNIGTECKVIELGY